MPPPFLSPTVGETSLFPYQTISPTAVYDFHGNSIFLGGNGHVEEGEIEVEGEAADPEAEEMGELDLFSSLTL